MLQKALNIMKKSSRIKKRIKFKVLLRKLKLKLSSAIGFKLKEYLSPQLKFNSKSVMNFKTMYTSIIKINWRFNMNMDLKVELDLLGCFPQPIQNLVKGSTSQPEQCIYNELEEDQPQYLISQ